ncbi:helix-hairpin-helix domain-containing protein [Streptomyces sp. NPDC018584]|uniref:helix-hairpin-helix domain-containing protein n=1 Tax=unclassified Streptomyces TaxID=2593676 RepID=UPI0037878D2B
MTSLRSPSRTVSPTSGPGRGPASDGRAQHRHARRRVRRGHASAEAVRLRARARAETLFAEPQLPSAPSPPPHLMGAPQRSASSPVRLDVAGPDEGLLPVGGDSGGGGAARGAAAVSLPGWAWREGADEAGRGAGAGREQGMGRGRAEDAGAGVRPLAEDAEAESVVEGKAQGGPARRERMGLAVRERLPVWFQARCGLERRGVIALVVVLAVAAVFAAQHFWTGRARPVQAPDIVREAGAAGEHGAEPAPSPGPPAEAGAERAAAAGRGGADAAAGPGGRIVVDVSGKVRRPGVHRLPAGSRVADALRAAGGARPGTDMGGLNRARFLVDGEQVVVGEPAPPPTPGGAGAVPGAGPAGAAGTAAAGPVGLNTATAAQLDELPGVGPVLAQHIIDYRTEHGGFRSVEELREVNGIGDRRFADLQNLVRP